MARQLVTIVDFIRHAASRLAAMDVCLGHGHDSPVDEARHLVLSALHLPPDLPAAYAGGRLTARERQHLQDLLDRRVVERVPVAYLTGEAWFAGLRFRCDPRALVPRSPFAELIESGFDPWLGGRPVQRALDLCTGSGCIGLAMAVYQPSWQVDLADVSAEALQLADENRADLRLDEARVHLLQSDLFDQLDGGRYDLIVSNPPYVGAAELAALPAEYRHEPELGLAGGPQGMDLVLRMLVDAPDFLAPQGLLMVEVGASQPALEALLPGVPFTWLEFQAGPLGVFVIDRDALLAHADDMAACLAQLGVSRPPKLVRNP